MAEPSALDAAILGEGNTSARCDGDTFWVKGSGCTLASMGAGDFVHLRFREILGLMGKQADEAIATKGVGVFDTLKAVAKLVLTELRKAGFVLFGEAVNDHVPALSARVARPRPIATPEPAPQPATA